MHTETKAISSIQIVVGDQNCIVSENTWLKAVDAMNIIADYSGCINVSKPKVVKVVRLCTSCALREAKLMAEAFFEPKFQDLPERGWRQYT